ncbi:hypothetical protein TKK_0011057 [Trichogramma kaykai]|uniref:DNA-directed DNA polymerase n=1 Tax=Trichogramma kaykai TaxID=54128 RepID=A0ABD2WUH4_9HYME
MKCVSTFTIAKKVLSKSQRSLKLYDQCKHEYSSSKQAFAESESDKEKQNLLKNETRFNEINLQMLSRNLYQQIFGNDFKRAEFDENAVLSVKKDLAKFEISTSNSEIIPDVNITIPPLKGSNIEEHFKNIAREQVDPYLNIIFNLLGNIPPMPKKFVFQEGWTKYYNNTYESVDYPEEDGLIYDVEVCVKNGPFPTLATAVGNNAWYSWCSKQLIDGGSQNFSNKIVTPDYLIPLESSKSDKGTCLNNFQKTPKIIVGHNVSYDRVRTKEQYWLNETATRFLDTMSLHICISGSSSYQRTILQSKSAAEENHYLHSISSLNNLADVHKLYCKTEINKEERNIFVEEEIEVIREKFQELTHYCASDVIATHNVLKKLFPMFLERFPHPATLAGMLELGSAYLPVNYNWKRYIEEAETTFDDLNLESKSCLSKRADQVCRLLLDEKYKENPWMWDEDWSIKDLKMKKGCEKVYLKQKEDLATLDRKPNIIEKFNYLEKTREYLPKKKSHLPGYPNWYRKLCYKDEECEIKFPKAQKISTSMNVTPKILNLSWKNYPLHHIKEFGWGFLVPYKAESSTSKIPLEQIFQHLSNKNVSPEEHNKLIRETIINIQEEKNSKEVSRPSWFQPAKSDDQPDANLDDCCYFFKLPHKDGLFLNVGNPLAKDFINKFLENVLTGIDASASRILEISTMSSYWKNNRDRILSQLVVWLDSKENFMNSKVKKNHQTINFGAIIPQVVVSGTLTRRAVEPTWMTASNAQYDRIGSELRAMINAPANYNIVGADVDSQELWIASVLGDAFSTTNKIQGGTPFSWMTLIGDKSKRTDMHSVTAKAIGISRDQAKIINYARIYGAGKIFAKRLLKQFNPTMSDKEASEKSSKMFLMTKGQKYFRLKENYISGAFGDRLYTPSETFKVAKLLGKNRDEVFERGKWTGGTESVMFNSLEEIAAEKHPATPFLNSRLSRALEKESNDTYLPTKINWVVQSSAVDFLHLILVNMRWLMGRNARLCLTFHDEVRYLVASKHKYNAALAMHVTNLMVRSFFVSRLQMKDLPMSVAFFTAVEVDSALRKEASSDCKTMSNPHGLKEGYGIEPGESLNVWTAIEKSKGCVGTINLDSKK